MRSSNHDVKGYYQGDVASAYLKERMHEIKWQREQDIVSHIVREYMQAGSTVLDVPFGTGRFAFLYKEKGIRVYGLDISKDMLEEAKRYLGDYSSSVDLILGNAEELPFPDGSIDYIVCVRLLNWVPMDVIERLLGEFSRVARSHIVIGIRTMSATGLFRRTLETLSKEPFSLLKHLAAHSVKRLSRKMARCKRRAGTELAKPAFYIHRNKSLLRLINISGLSEVERITVEEYDYSLRWIIAPLQLYVLSKDAKLF